MPGWTMITFESQVADRRRARGFFREWLDPEAALAILSERYWDDDDRAREPALRRILQRGDVSAVAYPTLDHRDVLKIFLRGDGSELVFACVLLGGARLRDMLAQSSPIVEGFALQVLSSEHPSVEGVRVALQSWIERCFPDLASPSLVVEHWAGPDTPAAHREPRASIRTVSLVDLNDRPEDHVLLSGDPDRRHEIVAARVTGSGIGIRSWYWSPSYGRYVSDPESGIWLDEDGARGLAAAIPRLVQQMEAYVSETFGDRAPAIEDP